MSSDIQPEPVHPKPKNSASSQEFVIKFWGVRGQIATPGKENLRYGGNTPCLEIRLAEKCLIFDGGTGLRELGNSLLRQMPVEAHLFFTHCHWDRIQGFPFFVPAFIPGNCFHIYGAEAANGASFQQRLNYQMRGPNFPVPMQVMGADLKFHHLLIGEKQYLEKICIETSFLNYEHRSIGYRINYQGKSVVYATDIDQNSELFPENIIKLSQNTDLLILGTPDLDLTCTNIDSIDAFWQISVEIANKAAVKKMVISLHNPDHNDHFLDQIEAQTQSRFPNTLFAREGMKISLE
jgi:phosphoribosyl 1,2-cyclic phosphodiesterase